MTAAPDLRALLVCPRCRGALDWGAATIVCRACAHDFPIVDGIPVMLNDAALAGHDEALEHAHGHAHARGGDGGAHKQGQADYFGQQDEEFEIERPWAQPWLYRWYYLEKARRGTRGLPSGSGVTALTVCGGSGMDAEFLARAGYPVICSDLSLAATRRARERARRRGLPIAVVVADVERLPFADRSIDVVLVHDGLHHLADPAPGLREIARVADRAVSITEPANATLTALAVRLGLALAIEPAGNPVRRFRPADVAEALQAQGFPHVRWQRYAMHHQHHPGWPMRLASLPIVRGVMFAAWRAANALLGRAGNRFALIARRD